MTRAVLGEPAWAMGVPLVDLKYSASLFRERHKALVFGAFGLVKERDIAAAMHRGGVLSRSGPNTERAMCLFHRNRVVSRQTDFAGRQISLQAGALVVSALACTDGKIGAALLMHACSEAGRGPLWVELFMEDETARAALLAYNQGSTDSARLRYVATKVTAGGEVKGLFSNKPTAPALDLAEHEALSLCSRVFLSGGMIREVLGELHAYERHQGGVWAQHYSSYNKRQSWTAFAVHGYQADDPRFIIKPAEMSKAWRREHVRLLTATPGPTTAAKFFPLTLSLVAKIPGAKDRIRFMRVAPGGELTRHADVTDRTAGVADGRIARLHIPLRTSPDVTFTAWDAFGRRLERTMKAGQLWYLDQRKPHAVVNKAPDLDRIHLVVDVASSADLRRWLCRYSTWEAPAWAA